MQVAASEWGRRSLCNITPTVMLATSVCPGWVDGAMRMKRSFSSSFAPRFKFNYCGLISFPRSLLCFFLICNSKPFVLFSDYLASAFFLHPVFIFLYFVLVMLRYLIFFLRLCCPRFDYVISDVYMYLFDLTCYELFVWFTSCTVSCILFLHYFRWKKKAFFSQH